MASNFSQLLYNIFRIRFGYSRSPYHIGITRNGIVLCSDTDEDIAKYSILNGNKQLFASRYKLYLPTEEELRAEIENQKAIFYLQQNTER